MRIPVLLAMLLACAGVAPAQRLLSAERYEDKLRGLWLGQILGNYAGRPSEGVYSVGYRSGNPAETVSFDFLDTATVWDGDDDTGFEYVYTRSLLANPAPTDADLRALWEAHVPLPSFYIANRQARWLMARGLAPPETGSYGRNMHWYAIDSQITTETLGALVPGMRQRAADLAGQFGAVSNDGYALHAAQFYAAMYADAAFESDVESLVRRGLEVVPQGSRTHEVVADVLARYEQDAADGTLDWRAAHAFVYDRYVGADARGRYRNWIESTVNVGMTTLALLYGQGDFEETIRIGVLSGFDSDCNPATAAGLIGFITGYGGLPEHLAARATDAYRLGTFVGLPSDTTVSALARDLRLAGEGQLARAGVPITDDGGGVTYVLPGDDTVAPPAEPPSPASPAGLVGQVRALGGQVSASAAAGVDDGRSDRTDLASILDGITDTRYNGWLPYWTYDGANAQPEGGDAYQIDFDREVAFSRVVFHEGDLVWTGINADPAVQEPRGGYFLDLVVEVRRDGQFVAVEGLALSEPLDPLRMHQRIELAFAPIAGDAVRIRGSAGGTQEFTTIVELEAFGTPWLGDADMDGAVTLADLARLATHWNAAGSWYDGDFSGDGFIDLADLAILAGNWNAGAAAVETAPPAVPEPSPAALLLAAALAAVLTRRPASCPVPTRR